MVHSRLHRWLTAAATLVVAAAASGVAAPAAASAATRAPYYLALGDSLAFGYQPNGDYTHGYVPDVYSALRRQIPGLHLENLGCPGETTGSLLSGPPAETQCATAYDQLNGTDDQLDAAVEFLSTHNVRVITIDIGGNDLAHCIGAGGSLDYTCVATAMATAPANLYAIVSALHAASPDTPIVGMSYYDPLLALWTTGVPSLQSTALASITLLVTYNGYLGAAYEAGGAAGVADVQDAFQTTNTTLVGGVPLDVVVICTLAWSCNPTYFLDIHPNTAGYALIAVTYLATIEPVLD